nr:transposase [uncultured Cupriavidus sp.]
MNESDQPPVDEKPTQAYVQRALVLDKPGVALNAVCLAITLQCKNLYNTAHFAVNNVNTAYDKVDGGYRLKDELHEHQRVAIKRFNAAIDRINAARHDKHEAEVAATAPDGKMSDIRLVARLESFAVSPLGSLLDITVLDNVLRTWPGMDGSAVYGRIPAAAAQQVLRRYKAAWAGYFSSLEKYTAGGAGFTGKPRPPSYLARDSRYVLEIPLAQIGRTLIGLGDKVIPVDMAETLSLTAEEMVAWNAYPILEVIDRAITRRGFRSGAPQHLRIVPTGRGVKFEAVVRVPRELDPNSPLATLERELAPQLANAKGKALTTSRRNEVCVKALSGRENVPAAGVDFGVNNVATVSYTTGSQAHVVSSGRFEVVMRKHDARIDRLKSTLMTPELRTLQARMDEAKTRGEKLSRGDQMTLRKGMKALYADPAYLEAQHRRAQWLNDFLHKLSHNLVRNCASRGVHVIVIGQNKGWKDGGEMDTVQNRRFHTIPHARLIELIRYKAEQQGIVVVTTEESYTSKTSFVNNEPLRKHSGKKQSKAAAETSATTQVDPEQTPAAHAPMGKRLKDKRNTFVNAHQTGRLARVHADVNAAFNILRKVFQRLAYHTGLTLKYTVMRLSPRLGLIQAEILGPSGAGQL